MSQIIVPHTSPASSRREEFPVDVFRYLEGKLHRIRNRTARMAAERARRSQEGEVYTVDKSHIDAALLELFADTHECFKELGFPAEKRSKE